MNCRTKKQSVFKAGLFKNKKVLLGILVEILLVFVLTYVPFLQGIFNTSPLAFSDWVFLIILPVPVILLEEIRKYIVRKRGNKSAGGK